MRAMQPFGACFQITVLLHDDCPHRFQPFEMHINGAIPNAAACHQGTQHQRRSTHRLDDLVLGRGVRENTATDRGAVLGAAVAQFDLGAHRSKQSPLCLDIADLGDVLQHHFVFGENCGGHAGQGGVFCAAHPNRS
jgi:hypothetical protein